MTTETALMNIVRRISTARHADPSEEVGKAKELGIEASRVIVRLATDADLPTMIEHSLAHAWEIENKRLNPLTVTAGVRHVVNDPTCISLVATLGNRLVGSKLIAGREWSEWENGFWLVTTGAYVLPDFRGQGIYKAMHGEAIR